MNTELQNIIHASRFVIEPGTYVYAKVRSVPQATDHFLVTQDKDEITVVTTVERLDELDVIERNKEEYKLIALEVSIPFYSVGFLAAVSTAIAEEGMNVLLVSTYSKDYILIKQADQVAGEKVLLDLGLK